MTLPGPNAAPAAFPINGDFTMLSPVLRLMHRLDDHWIGDLIGSVCLFILLFEGLWFGSVLGFK